MKTTALTLITALALGSFASAKGKPAWAAAAKPGKQNIVEIVLADDGEFDVLQAAVIRAGLVDALSGKKQLTVFAPTDDAFIALLEAADEAAAIAAVETLEVEALTDILLYHVTKGRRISKSVLAAPKYKMLNGDKLTRAELLDAGVAETDISASNGIIHVIDSVLVPKAD
ncbi:MAG TPA: fasciclin domain-containing protein [Luteolibacter sp.]|nr:fasciclin domain-containing protein [Luteolibacter sp.]